MEQVNLDRPAQRVSGATVGLVVGDILSFLVFSALGRNSHGEAAGLRAIAEVAGTAAPFLIGWFAVASGTGALRGSVLRTPVALLKRTALTWLLAWPLGLLLRALFLQRGIPLSFAIVTGVANSVLLLGWRGIAAFLVARRAS